MCSWSFLNIFTISKHSKFLLFYTDQVIICSYIKFPLNMWFIWVFAATTNARADCMRMFKWAILIKSWIRTNIVLLCTLRMICTKIPYRCNFNSLEITVFVISIQCSKAKVTISQLIDALAHTIPAKLLGHCSIYRMQANSEQKALD